MPPALPTPAVVIRLFWRAQSRVAELKLDSADFSFLPAETLLSAVKTALHAEHLGGVRRDRVDLLPAARIPGVGDRPAVRCGRAVVAPSWLVCMIEATKSSLPTRSVNR